MEKLLKRLKRKNSGILRIVSYMLKNKKVVYTYKDSFSNSCEKIVWQQKYEPCLRKLGIITRVAKGKYTFNLNQLCYILFFSILEEEKAEVITLVISRGNLILKKYMPYFAKHDKLQENYDLKLLDSFLFVPKLKVKTGDEQKIEWIARQSLKLQKHLKAEMDEIFCLFAQCHLTLRMPKKVRLLSQIITAFDGLMENIEIFFSIDELKGECLEYFISSLHDVLREDIDYMEMKSSLTNIWRRDAEMKPIPALMILPYIKSKLKNERNPKKLPPAA